MESSVDGDSVVPTQHDLAVKILHLSELSVELGTSLSTSCMEGEEWGLSALLYTRVRVCVCVCVRVCVQGRLEMA